jgi:hypothetical protein
MTKTAAEVELEVEASRQDLDRTVEALKEKMTPGQIFDEASRAMGGAGNQILSKFVEQAKENPMPLAVMGLGLAWLMTSQNKRPAYAGAYQPQGYATETYSSDGYGAYGSQSDGGGGRGKVSGAAHAVADKASGALSSAKEGLASAKHGLANAASGAAQSTRSAAGNLSSMAGGAASKVGEYRQQAQRKVAETYDNDPMMIGAVGLVVGAVVGAALPSTQVENRTFGSARDRILDKGKDLAQDGLDQAKGVAQAAYGSVKSEIERTAEDGGNLSDRAEQVARAGTQAVQEQLRPN